MLSLRCLYCCVASIECRSFSEGNRNNREFFGEIFGVAISGLLKLHEKSPLEVVETFQRAILVSADGGNRTPETAAPRSFILVFSRLCSFIRWWRRCYVVFYVVCCGICCPDGVRIQVVQGIHEVLVDLGFLGADIFLIAFQHEVGRVAHAFHGVLFWNVEGGHDGSVVMA